MSRKAKSLDELETRIGHVFADKAILERALTHISAASPRQGRGGSYQRLEFLGDHVLGLAVSDMLYRAFPKADEGELSRRLADLVRRDTCAEVARAIDLGAALKLGNSESNAGGRKRTATLADVCEALIGNCATPRLCCRNGRKGAACRHRSTARWSGPGRTTVRNFAWRSIFLISRQPRAWGPPSALPSRRPRPQCSRAKV
jgi:hypothetical protein